MMWIGFLGGEAFLSSISFHLSVVMLNITQPWLILTGRVEAVSLLNDGNCVNGGVKHLQLQ